MWAKVLVVNSCSKISKLKKEKKVKYCLGSCHKDNCGSGRFQLDSNLFCGLIWMGMLPVSPSTHINEPRRSNNCYILLSLSTHGNRQYWPSTQEVTLFLVVCWHLYFIMCQNNFGLGRKCHLKLLFLCPKCCEFLMVEEHAYLNRPILLCFRR